MYGLLLFYSVEQWPDFCDNFFFENACISDCPDIHTSRLVGDVWNLALCCIGGSLVLGCDNQFLCDKEEKYHYA